MCRNENCMSPVIITMKSSHKDSLDKLVKESNPFESCALLLGKKTQNEFIVEEVVAVKNNDSSIVKFTMEPESLLKIYAYSESINLAVIGIFHSHPSRAYPSGTDVKYMQVNPVPWIIESTITNEKRCFVLNQPQDGLHPEIIEVKINIKD